MSFNFENRVAIVTGGSKGIGSSICEYLSKNGAKVYSLSRSIPESGLEGVTYKKCDVSNFEDVQTVFTDIHKEAGSIDILVNNAGVTKDNLIMRMNEADWDTVLDINLKSAFNTVKAVARIMMGQRKGKIINIGSIVGTTGNAGQSNYSASKAGLVGFTKSLAKELASRNILVNLIAPGYVMTEMTEKLDEDQLRAFLDNIPLKRGASGEEIAKVVGFFASDDSNYVTGQVLHVDGGLAM